MASSLKYDKPPKAQQFKICASVKINKFWMTHKITANNPLTVSLFNGFWKQYFPLCSPHFSATVNPFHRLSPQQPLKPLELLFSLWLRSMSHFPWFCWQKFADCWHVAQMQKVTENWELRTEDWELLTVFVFVFVLVLAKGALHLIAV